MKFLEDLAREPGVTHCVTRENLFDDVLQLYRSSDKLLNENPFRVSFSGEKALDFGGVCREMFSGFWEKAYTELFDGSGLLIPITHKKSVMKTFATLGYVISHGYLVCGYLPCRIAFPSLASICLGTQVEVPDEMLINTFADFISPVEASFIKGCFTIKGSVFSSSCQAKLISILSRFGTRGMSTPAKLREQISEAAYQEFLTKPMAAVNAMNNGIPPNDRSFWNMMTVEDLHNLYLSLTASPSKVVEMLVEPLALNPAQERVFGYLVQYVGCMKINEAQRFLRFVTGSSVCLANVITVEFNGLSGLARRPIGHTCSSSLELSTNYDTYLDFAAEFNCVLNENNEYTWIMDSH